MEINHQFISGGIQTSRVLSTFEYDGLGKLKQKVMFPEQNIGLADRTIDYSYHIQGMLEKISSPLFSETLIYGSKNKNILSDLSNFTPYYNGNISAKKTMARLTPNATTITAMQDVYKYDQLDRLTDDFHSGNGDANFSVRDIGYDLEGNVLNLTRYGKTREDNFGVVNKIENTIIKGVPAVVSNNIDLWPSYGSQTYLPSGTFVNNVYDNNGNRIYDDARETFFFYNHLNLATEITNPHGRLFTEYDAAGSKVKETIIENNDTTIRYFNGGSIYEKDGDSMKLIYHALPEGYISNGRYDSVIHDYLGSVRTVIDVDSNKTVEINHYDPWGVEYGLSNSLYGVQMYKHQGMERLRVTGFVLHDHGWRIPDNVHGGEWLTRDPLEEMYYWNSPYVYCNNNPLRFVDKDGREIRLAGTAAERLTSLSYLQRLTNDRLSMSSSGSVSIVKTGSENSGKKLTVGSNLIRDLSKTGDGAKIVTISIVTTGNSASTADKNASGNVDWTNSTNGTGANATVNFDPTCNTNVPTIDPTTGNVSNASTPYEVALAHELIHAEHINNGTVDFSEGTNTYQTAEGTKTETRYKEELKTVGLPGYDGNKVTENKIREEQGVNKRGAYK
jgi:RHS repeat-associated protein